MSDVRYGYTFPDGTKLRVIVTTADECADADCAVIMAGNADAQAKWDAILDVESESDWPDDWPSIRAQARAVHEHVYPQTFAYTLNGEDARRKSVMAAWNAQSDEARALAGLALNNLLGANK